MKFIVFDTEDDSREVLEAGKPGHEKRVTQIAAITTHGEQYHNRGDREAFLEWVLDSGIKRVYAHNLQYDLGNLFADHLDMLNLTMVGGRVIKAGWRGITFVDSFNLFPMSVKSMGEAFGLRKLRFDAEDREYVFRDCEIVLKALMYLLKVIRPYGLTELPNTLGGLCVRLWQAMGGENWNDASPLSREAIFGGRVELFSNGGTGNIAWTDVNSLYPWAMTQKFPAVISEQKDLTLYGVTRARVKVPEQEIAPLPYRVKWDDGFDGVWPGAILFPCGNFDGVWTNAELVNAVDNHGVKIEKIYESWGSNHGEAYYADFVNDFYDKRLKSESDAEKLVYKLLMNNLYGQLGMSGIITTSTKGNEKLFDEIRRGEMDATAYGDNLLMDRAIPLPKHCNYTHASYVTAYGRLRLIEFMKKIPVKDLVYCDTDSLFFFNKGDKLPFHTGRSLGEMKFEGWGKKVEVYAPKMYVFDDKAKAKGVPRRLAKKFIEEMSVEYDAPFRMREAIRFFDRGNTHKLSVWRKIKKQFRTNYRKKKLTASKHFIPLCIDTKTSADNAASSPEKKKGRTKKKEG